VRPSAPALVELERVA